MTDTREFPSAVHGDPILLERSEHSRSMWVGQCPSCKEFRQEHTCYRCDRHIPYPPGIALRPPFGSVDARGQNWLCPPCLVELQTWLGAPADVVEKTATIFLPAGR